MNPTTILFAVLTLLVVALLAAAGTAYVLRQPPSAAVLSVEHELARVATDAIAKLADNSGDQKVIEAAKARMQLRNQLLADIHAGVPKPDQVQAALPLPTIPSA